MQLSACSPDPKYMKLPRLRFEQQLGQDGAVALAVDEPRPDDRRRQPVLAMVFEDQGLGLGLGPGVGVERIGGRGHGLVGPVMVAPLVHAERADVDEPLELGGNGGIEQQAERFHVEPAELSRVPQSPTLAAQLNTQSAPATPGSQRLGIFQVADDRLHAPLVEPARVARGPDEGPDPMAALQGLFGRMAADQPGRAGDEDRFRCRRVHDAPHGSGKRQGRARAVILPHETAGKIRDRGGIGIVAQCTL